MFGSISGRLAQACLCSLVLQDGWPSLAQRWLMLQLLMCSSIIGILTYIVLYLVVLLHAG